MFLSCAQRADAIREVDGSKRLETPREALLFFAIHYRTESKQSHQQLSKSYAIIVFPDTVNISVGIFQPYTI
jgi:hypothetical protein